MVRQMEIASPMKGRVLQLASIKDDAFASGVLGKGAAVLPDEGEVYAPADGVVSALFPTLHALCFGESCKPEDVWEALLTDQENYFFVDVQARGAYPSYARKRLGKRGVMLRMAH